MIIAWCLPLLLLAELLFGFALTRLRWPAMARLAAWLLTCAAVVASERLLVGQPALLRMLALFAAMFWGLKVVVSVDDQARGRPRLTAVQWWLFALGWFGMRPVEFAGLPGKARDGVRELIGRGTVHLLTGVLVVLAARALWQHSAGWLGEGARFAGTAALLLLGLCLTVNFGFMNVLAAMWRAVGADCQEIFRAPLRSSSLSEFWSRRWNRAFSEMAAVSVFRPLRPFIGSRAATAVVFLLSGLLHELAISLPVQVGFGMPLLYFGLHAIGVLFEKSLAGHGYAVDRQPWVGGAWTAAWVLLPLPLLFHAPFVRGCLGGLVGMNAH